jgi:N-acyl-phosphatidylethanolamine-hydrolysing phospholipase D
VRRGLRALVVVGALIAAACAGAGGSASGRPAHHGADGFTNLNPAFRRPPFWTRASFLISRIVTTTFAPRTAHFPRVPNDGAALRDNHGEPTVTWVGHSTLLVQLDGLNILTDPQWSERASPVSFAGPRRASAPGLRFDDLPPIHLVVISHDHYDHLDVRTVRRLASRHRPRFVVPLGLRAWFLALGIEDVHELDWWQSVTMRDVTVTCLPAQHFSGRTLTTQNRSLWASWAITGSTRRFFFAGDTGYYGPLFKEIGARLGPFDLAAVPIGAYLPPTIMRFVHTTPEEALDVFADLRASRFLGIHWGTFDLAEEPLDEPPRRLLTEAYRRGLDTDHVWILSHGETRRW